MISEKDQELLSAYIDGELATGEVVSIKERLLAEPELRRELESMRVTDQSLLAFADQINESEIPERLRNVIPDESQPLHAYGFFAAAASVLILIGGFFVMQDEQPSYEWLSEIESGKSVESETGSFEVVASFYRRDGVVCREAKSNSSRAVFCRVADEWQLVIDAPRSEIPNGSYVPAGPQDAGAIDAYVSEHIDGMVLDKDAERRMINQGWK